MSTPVNQIPTSSLHLKEAKEIGRGSYATVYQMTWNRQLGPIQVAAKRLNKPEDDTELKILSKLDHPNIVKLLGVVDEGINFLLILELCEGGSLRKYLDGHQDNHLPTDQFFDWAKQAALPVQYLQENNIVHKDIKSPNILISKENILKLADFGLAKNIAESISNATQTASYPWMAPELLYKAILSPTFDIFTLGVVFWELWTRQFPFKGVEWEQIVWKVCEKDERLPIPPDMPKSLADLIRQCWATDCKQRPGIQHILDEVSDACNALTTVRHVSLRGK